MCEIKLNWEQRNMGQKPEEHKQFAEITGRLFIVCKATFNFPVCDHRGHS